MAKLDMGILAVLGLGVGAFVLSRTSKAETTEATTTEITDDTVTVDTDKPLTPTDPEKPVINSFSYNPKSGVSEVTVNFNLGVNVAGSTINWDFGDGTFEYGLTSPKHRYFSSTNGSVTVISKGGRSEKKTFSITVTKKEDVKLETKGEITNVGLSPKKGTAPLTVNASVSGTRKIQDVWWEFGDGLKGHGQSKGTVYKNKGTYNGSVKVTFDNGDVDIETFTVVVTELKLEASIRLFYTPPLKTGQQVLYTIVARNTIGSTKVKWDFWRRFRRNNSHLQ